MIIVDDASPDDGAGCKVVQFYSDKDSKTKMIKPQWNIYRKVLKMNLFSSAWYLFCWGINGIFKYKIRRVSSRNS